MQEPEDMKGVRAVRCAHHGRGSWGLEFPELLPVPGCFGKLTRLALASEVALGWWTNTESSALPQSCFMPGLPSLPAALAAPGAGRWLQELPWVLWAGTALWGGPGRAAVGKGQHWGCGTA